MANLLSLAATVLVFFAYCAASLECDVFARTETGVVGGLRRFAENGGIYASFRGVPYAKQPLGELRFQDLQPAEPWQGVYNATVEGPGCMQVDALYGPLLKLNGMSEACIFVNIHVPIDALPDLNEEIKPTKYRPIIVFIHGGGFDSGSGDSGVFGPEYIVSKDAIVITFNYRLNVIGFLSLNTASVPGNAGLRDAITLLRWVQRNARNFGGDPENVTIAGQSSGGVCTHILSLSPLSAGLFNKAIVMSGNGIDGFFNPTMEFAKYVSNIFFTELGITATDPEEIHRILISTPIEKIMEANKVVQDTVGLASFGPVIETPFQGVDRVLDDHPDVLVEQGRGNHIPMVIGFCDSECETLRLRLESYKPLEDINRNSLLHFYPKIALKVSNSTLQRIYQESFQGEPTMDKYVKLCSDGGFIQGSLKLAEKRAATGGAPVYLYQFSYNPEHSIIRDVLGLKYNGSGHIEDAFNFFRVNSALGAHRSFPPQNENDRMRDWMTTLIVNFLKYGNPTCGNTAAWPPVNQHELMYQDIRTPMEYRYIPLTDYQKKKKEFFDSVEALA